MIMWEHIKETFQLESSKDIWPGWIKISKVIADKYYIYPGDILLMSIKKRTFLARAFIDDNIPPDKVIVNDLTSKYRFGKRDRVTLMHYLGEVNKLDEIHVKIFQKNKKSELIDIFNLLGDDIFISSSGLFLNLGDRAILIDIKGLGESVGAISYEYSKINYSMIDLHDLTIGVIISAHNSMNHMDVPLSEEDIEYIEENIQDFPISISLEKTISRLSFSYIFTLTLLRKLLNSSLFSKFNLFIFQEQGIFFSARPQHNMEKFGISYPLNVIKDSLSSLTSFFSTINIGKGVNQIGNALYKYFEMLRNFKEKSPDLLLIVTDDSEIFGVHPIDVIKRERIDRKIPIIAILTSYENKDLIELYSELSEITSGELFQYSGNLLEFVDRVLEIISLDISECILRGISHE